MKVLRVNAYFRLPDDFEGNFEDAMKLFLAFKEREIQLQELFPSVSFTVSHHAFAMNQEYGFRCIAETGVWHLSDKWNRIDKDPEHAHKHSKSEAWVK